MGREMSFGVSIPDPYSMLCTRPAAVLVFYYTNVRLIEVYKSRSAAP